MWYSSSCQRRASLVIYASLVYEALAAGQAATTFLRPKVSLRTCREVSAHVANWPLPSKTLHTCAAFAGSTGRYPPSCFYRGRSHVYRGSQVEGSNRLRSQHARPICFEWLAALSVELWRRLMPQRHWPLKAPVPQGSNCGAAIQSRLHLERRVIDLR